MKVHVIFNIYADSLTNLLAHLLLIHPILIISCLTRQKNINHHMKHFDENIGENHRSSITWKLDMVG